MGKVVVVVGAQFGSEGKGAVAGYLAAVEPMPLMAVRVAGPNAGHCVIGNFDKKYALQQVPVAAVTNRDAELRIAAGSEVDPEVLESELEELDNDGFRISQRLLVDSSATLMIPDYGRWESGDQTHGLSGITRSIGSTGKGVGAARADRIWRAAGVWGKRKLAAGAPVDMEVAHWLRAGNTVMVEGTQGYGLGLHTEYYPFTTSSDCRAIDFLAMAGISPWADYVSALEVWVVARTLPIRVAGNSGPLYGEATWDDFHTESDGLVPKAGEFTTVTKKQRRVGRFDMTLVRQAIRANGGPPVVKLAVTFVDYLFKKKMLVPTPLPEVEDWITVLEAGLGVRPLLLTYGPTIYDTIDRRTLAHERN